MAERLYKNGINPDGGFILDDRSVWYPAYGTQCSICKYFRKWDYFCEAYPDGIPDELLEGKAKHDEVRPDQTGVIVFEKGDNSEFWFYL